MPTYTDRLRLIQQAYGSNPEAWGGELNNGVIGLIDEIFTVAPITVNGPVVLSVQNAVSDQSRRLVLWFDGAGNETVEAPAVDKAYFVVNDCAADIVLEPQGGTGATIRANSGVWWFTNGSTSWVIDPKLNEIPLPDGDVDLNGNKIVGLADGVADDDAATVGQIGPFADAAAQSASDALTSENNTRALYNDFQKRYLGAFAAAPTLDLNGDPLVAGALYFNTNTTSLNVYDGVGWAPIDLVTFADQTQAEAGTDNDTVMTPLRTAQAIEAQAPALIGMVAIGDPIVLPSNASAVDIVLPSGYVDYVIKFWGVRASANFPVMNMRTSSNGGSSFDAGASDYYWASIERAASNTTVTAANGNGVAQIQICSNASSAANASTEGTINIRRPGASAFTSIEFSTATAVTYRKFWGAGWRASTSPVDAVRFLLASGDIEAGATFQLFGEVVE